MPKQVTDLTNHYKKWNMYVNEIEKAEYLMALAKAGKSNAQSAAVRAFMYLYANDIETRNKINSILDRFMVYNQNGKPSIM